MVPLIVDVARLLLLLSPEPHASIVGKDQNTTAVYDIAAATVTLPSGQKMTAHSGMHQCRDNPKCAHIKFRGPTPPGEYRVALLSKPFYGDRALRLEPKDVAKMHGRDGMLAHSYLGMGGNSMGCVSFENY